MPLSLRGVLSHPLVPVAGVVALSGVVLANGATVPVVAWVVVGMAAGYSISGSV